MKLQISLSKKFILPVALLITLTVLAGVTTGLFGKDTKISMAVLPVENLNKDPKQEYLAGIIGSLIRQDLSISGMIFLVNRENLEDVLNEQKLQFSGVLDEKSIIESGRLIGAEYILKGGYVFLGEDLFLNLDLINTETGRSYSFSERGYQENTVHALTEKLIYHLTGQEISLQSDNGTRTIIAKNQLEPGRLVFFSYLVDARIYIDGSFSSYTTGDSKKPVELVLPPGKHTIRTHLTDDFGVIKEPEILFSDWIQEFTIISGETLVVEDKTTHFNSLLYKMQQVIRERLQIVPGSGETGRAEHITSFIDRQGVEIPIRLELSFVETGGDPKGGMALVHLEYNGVVQDLTYDCPSGESAEFQLKLFKSDLKIDMDCSSEYRWTLNYSIWRNDIYQGIHREEEHQVP